MKTVSVAAIVEEAIGRGGKRLISVPAMITRLRDAVPDCEHTDDELAHLVSIIAISKGCDLSFVGRQALDPVGAADKR